MAAAPARLALLAESSRREDLADGAGCMLDVGVRSGGWFFFLLSDTCGFQ